MGKAKMSAEIKNISPVVKEAVKSWLEEALLRQGEESEEAGPPVEGLAERVIKVLVKEHKGKGPKAVKQAFNELKPQIEFVGLLIYSINDDVDNKQREMIIETELLLEKFKRIAAAMSIDDSARAVALGLGEMPYPLSQEMAELFLSLDEHAVKSWSEIKNEILPFMVKEHFISQGKKEIPAAWLRLLYPLNSSEEAEIDEDLKEEMEEARSAFESPEAFSDFLEGKDFTHGLADVRNEEFDMAVETLAKEIESLSEVNVLEKENLLTPKDPPNNFMTSIPLVEREWIDKEALELLEWYKTILNMGYEALRLEDNSVAWPIIIEPEKGESESESECEDEDEDESESEDVGEERYDEEENDDDEEEEEEEEIEIDDDELKILDKQKQYEILWDVRRRLSSIALKERVIDGRTYVSLSDYLSQEDCLFGEEDLEIEEGITVRSWNKWFEEQKDDEAGSAKLAGFEVFDIANEIEPDEIHILESQEEAIHLQELREGLNLMVTRMQLSTPVMPFYVKRKGIEDGWYVNPCLPGDQPVRELIATLREMVFYAFANYTGMKMAILSLADEFLDGTNFLHEAAAESLDHTIERIAEITRAYNEIIANQLEILKTLGLINWANEPPYGWEALFPQGFFIDLDDVAEAAKKYAFVYRKRCINMAQPK
ncbi:MAG: hypothetical protein PWP50_612 [Synergistaceae bacterium]|nr:hypothetical protein [Synergistaceae bacterium]